MNEFTPELFINFGQSGKQYTLRETYAKNLSLHVKSLGNNPDDAMKAAQAHSYANKIKLRTTRDELPNSLVGLLHRPTKAPKSRFKD